MSTGGNAPPPVPKRISMSNIFHTVKRQVFGAKERTVVQSFDEAKAQFDAFFEVLNTLSANVQLVSERYSLLATSLSSTWLTLANQFQSVPDSNLTPIANAGTQRHESFLSERVLIAKASLTAATNTLGQAQILARELIAEMKLREENLSEFDYYTKKLAELQAERDKVVASGKPVKPKDQERLDRNIAKTNESRTKYETHHATLMQRLHGFLDQRTMFIAPVLSGVVTSEQNFVQELSTALQSIVNRADDEPIRMSMAELENDATSQPAGPEADTTSTLHQVVPAQEGHSIGANPFGTEVKSAEAEADPFASLGTPSTQVQSPPSSVYPSLPTPSRPLPLPPNGALPPVPGTHM